MPGKSFHVGIDYGTSASKLVVRHYDAPGGELAELIPCGTGVRHPATVTWARGKLYFREAADIAARAPDAIRYDSIKMRVAAEVTGKPAHCFAPCPALPPELTAKHLAVLSVWSLLTAAREHVVQHMGGKRWFRTPEFKLLSTLGIPTSFFVDPALRRCFWDVLEGARHLVLSHGHMPAHLGVEAARDRANEALAAGASSGIESDDFELRRMLRPESEAALWWAIQSPAVPAGPYIKIDIGAGTTNVSFFRMNHGWNPRTGYSAQKERLCFFGAASVARGMDAIDRALCGMLGGSASDALALRGEEEQHVDSPAGARACENPIAEIYMAVRQAWGVARPQVTMPHEIVHWTGAIPRPGRPPNRNGRELQVVAVGGGSLVRPLIDRVARHPNAQEERLPCLGLEAPPDLKLDGKHIPPRALPFAAVAYGLANLDPVAAEWCDGLPPPTVPPPAPRLTHEELYAR